MVGIDLISLFSSAYIEVFRRILIGVLSRTGTSDNKCVDCGFLGKRASGNPELLELRHTEREAIWKSTMNWKLKGDKLPSLECKRGIVAFPDTSDSALPEALDALLLISRTSCRHYSPHSPGRTPHEHLQLELEQRRQRNSQYALVISSTLLFVSIVVNIIQAAVA